MNNTELILTVLVSVIAAGVLFQLILLFVMFLAVRKGMKAAGQYASEMKEQAVPVLENSKALIRTARELIARLEPKLESAASDLAEVTKLARTEAKRMQESADEITDKVRHHATRVDAMTTDALNAVERVGSFVSMAVTAPVRQVSGIMAGAKAVLETLRTPTPRPR
jgi:predicted nuclease with TOPRIM domain